MTERTIDPDTREWHLDKRIPVALIAATFIQFGGFVWFVATMNAKVDQVVEDVVDLKEDYKEVISERDDIRDRVIRIEEKIIGQNVVLNKIEKALTSE